MKENANNDTGPASVHRGQPAKVLIPLLPSGDNTSLIALAHCLAVAEPVLLMGLVPMPVGDNLSAGAEPARELRRLIHDNADRVNLRSMARIRVTHMPWDDIRNTLSGLPSVDLVVLSWPDQLKALRLTAAEILSHPPCDVALLRGPLAGGCGRILVPVRGGPHAERALRMGLGLAQSSGGGLTCMQLMHHKAKRLGDADAFAGMAQVLAELPEVEHLSVETDDRVGAIMDASKEFDTVILGTAGTPGKSTDSFGDVADHALREAAACVIAVKTKRVASPGESGGGDVGSHAISVLVDRWFAENTFHSDEFADLNQLEELKDERGTSISVALPALNEEETVGEIIRSIQRVFMEQTKLVDELILMDSNSTDRTREIAEDMGVPVYVHQEILPELGARDGKGEALWKSLHVTTGDILIWVDTDVVNFHPRFIYGLIGPLLHRTGLMFVKSFYRRPLRSGRELKAGRGGRVTELTARPLLNLFYPELSGVVQPLAGEYGGRREALEQLAFTSGYGVETSLLIDVFERHKLQAIGQVDLEERIHRNQPLPRLSKMSFAIIQTMISKLERRYGREMLEDVNRTMKTVHYEPGHFFLEVEEIAELERPCMLDIPEYRERRGLAPLK